MKLIYTNENRMLVGNIRNILDANGIETVLKNEYSQGGVGEISAFDAWPELWLINDSDFDSATAAIENASSKPTDPEWTCKNCGEVNDASFGACWQCQDAVPTDNRQ